MHTPRFLHRGHQVVKSLGSFLVPALLGSAFSPGEDTEHTHTANANLLRDRLEGLGPVFVKLGQLLSTRPDLLSSTYTDALRGLQSRVSPMEESAVVRSLSLYEKRLGKNPFTYMDKTPIAAASLAQVHRAKLQDGTWVAVKIRREGVVRTVEEDLKLLKYTSNILQRLIPEGERQIYDLPGTVEELSISLRDELDLRNEAENLLLFGRNLTEWKPLLSVPYVYEDLCTDSVLVMELISGQPLTSHKTTDLDSVHRRRLATALAHAYFKMFFVDGVFHADPHPGNVLLTDDGNLVLLDFGMIGRIERQVSDNLVRVLLNFQLRDSHGVAHAFLDIGKPTSTADEIGWIMEVRRLLPRYHGMRLERLNVGTLLIDLLRSAARCGIQAPPIVALLCKSLANMDGSARLVDPDISVLAVFRDFLPSILLDHAQRRASPEEAAKVALDLSMGPDRAATPANGGACLRALPHARGVLDAGLVDPGQVVGRCDATHRGDCGACVCLLATLRRP